MSRRPVYVHIGLQKTGTSYLQAIFWRRKQQLRAQGLDLVPGSQREAFQLMLDVRNRYVPGRAPTAVLSAVGRLPDQLAAASGPRALITEESLAPATVKQAGRLTSSCSQRDVHIVLTVRDLARVVPSMWQQRVRSGSAARFEDYVERVLGRDGPEGRRFWRNHDLTAVLDRWGRGVPPDHIHVVTVPPADRPPQLLLERYCSVFGVDHTRMAVLSPRRNSSLGRAEIELLRRVNEQLPDQRRRGQEYGIVGKRYFGQRVLGGESAERTRLPEALEPWCQDQFGVVADLLVGGGYDVVGDVDDLRPLPDSFEPTARPVTDGEVAASAVAAIATMLEQRMVQRERRRSEAEPRRRPASPAHIPRPRLGRVRHRAEHLLHRGS